MVLLISSANIYEIKRDTKVHKKYLSLKKTKLIMNRHEVTERLLEFFIHIMNYELHHFGLTISSRNGLNRIYNFL